MATRQAHARHLQSVPFPALALRRVHLASWHGAKMRATNHTVPLNAASAAGLYLEAFGDADVAAGKVQGSDDWSAQVRNYLRAVAEEERRARVTGAV